MTEFKIRYRNGKTQLVTADKYALDGQFFIFERGEEGAILHVAIMAVESVGRADVPDPGGQIPEDCEIFRSEE